MKASKFQLITGIIAFLGFIGGIVLGVKVGDYAEEIGIIVVIEAWVAVALYCIPLVAIISSLKKQEIILFNQRSIEEKIRRIQNSVTNVPYEKSNSSSINTHPNTSETWTCKGCGEVNRGDKRICQACGRDK